MSTIFLIAIIAFFSYMILTKLDTIERRLARQQSILDQLSQDLPEPPAAEEIRSLVMQGESIQAIKLAREIFGFSLLEAKQYVDRIKENT